MYVRDEGTPVSHPFGISYGSSVCVCVRLHAYVCLGVNGEETAMTHSSGINHDLHSDNDTEGAQTVLKMSLF